MQKYICSICGFVYDEATGYPEGGIAPGTKWEDIPRDWVCPLCGATKDEFKQQNHVTSSTPSIQPVEVEDIDALRELSFEELSVLCSNLSKGCEKQYLTEEAELFNQLADYYIRKSTPASDSQISDLIALIEEVESFSVSCRKVIAGYQNDLPYYSGMLDRVSIRDGKKSLSAIKKNVTVSVENGILTIRLFPLIKNLSARTKEYISLLISDAIKEYFTANPMLDFGCENCVIVINSHYARPELVRDNDSVEVSAIVNAIKTYFLTDDDGLHLAIYRTGTISDRHETEINVMKITDFVQYLIQHSRHAHS